MEGLVWSATLPLSWVLLEAMPTATELANQCEANLRVLRNVTMLEDLSHVAGDPHLAPGTEMARVERKLDLLLDLMQHFISTEVARPTRRALSLTGAGIEWQGGDMPSPGSLIGISVHLNETYPRALQLNATVAGVRNGVWSETGPGARARVDFVNHGEEVCDALDKLVFQQHRREIAARRRGF